jgi:hypothetical protein
MYNLPEVSESLDNLKALMQKERDARVQRRFQMLQLVRGRLTAYAREAVISITGYHYLLESKSALSI